MSDRPRPARIALAAMTAIAGAIAVVEALWMLLLGLSMAYGNPLGAPDSAWRVAAGVGIGSAAVLFGAGLAALARGRRDLAVVGLGAGAALYTGLYLAYPGELDQPALWAAIVLPWLAAAVAAGIWAAARRPGTTKAPAHSTGAFVE